MAAGKLLSRDLEGLVSFLQDAKKVVILTGAGVSVSAGIPDFRSAGGMYDTLKPDLLTATPAERRTMARYPTFVVSWEIFGKNSLPYLELRRPFILGTQEQQWKATTTHWFFRLLHDKGKLQRIYTQNIDGLDYQVGVPSEKIVPVHGSLAKVMCEGCGSPYPEDKFAKKLKSDIKDIYGIDPAAPKVSTPISCDACEKPLVKPATVLYGRSLPSEFFESVENDFDKDSPDVVLVFGTSLTVSPANKIPLRAPPDCVRVIINREQVGQQQGIGKEPNDIFLGGDCDDVALKIAEGLGWKEDLQNYQKM